MKNSEESGCGQHFLQLSEEHVLQLRAVGEAAEVHDRMPLIVPKEQLLNWLTNTAFAVRHLDAAMPELEKREY